MANGNSYVLTSLILTPNQGGNTAQIQVAVTDGVTGVTTLYTRQITPLGATPQGHVDALVAEALTYLTATYPAATFTLPPAPPAEPI